MQISVALAAKLLNTTERKIYEWIRKESIPYRKVGDHYRFHRTELLEWATGLGMALSIENFPQSQRGGSDTPPAFGEALRVGGVFASVDGVDRQAVLASIVALLPLDEDADRELLYDVMLAREALGSTGIGNGIAIPHVRAPVVMQTTGPSVTLCYLKHAIDFDAIDGKPVHTFFTLITPTIRAHLYLLSRLSAALQDPEFLKLVTERAVDTSLFAVADALDLSLNRNARPEVK